MFTSKHLTQLSIISAQHVVSKK